MPLPPPPSPVIEWCARLREHGHGAWLLGEALAELGRGLAPRQWILASSASADEVLALARRAVPTAPCAAVLTLPTAAGPIDHLPGVDETSVEKGLAEMDFRIHAMAYDPVDERLLDPLGGMEDLEAGSLRCPPPALQRMRRQPVRALRAARLVAETPLECDAELEEALRSVANELPRASVPASRAEILRMIAAPRAGAGIELLRRTGLEAALLHRVEREAPRWIDALRAERDDLLVLRLSVWLRGGRATPFLRRLRIGEARSARILNLIDLHPIEDCVRPQKDASVRRLLRRIPISQLAPLLSLRALELEGRGGARAEAARGRLRSVREAIEAAAHEAVDLPARRPLPLDGRAVMEILGCGPGPQIGRALEHLEQFRRSAGAQPSDADLRAELLRWSAGEGLAGAGPA